MNFRVDKTEDFEYWVEGTGPKKGRESGPYLFKWMARIAGLFL